MLDRLLSVTDPIIDFFSPEKSLSLNEEYLKYISQDYPQNHTFNIVNQQLKPRYKLASRYKKLITLYPDHLTSLVDVGCSKGFFVFSANEFPTCQRSLGIDINPYALNVCRWLKTTIQQPQAKFEKLYLHELAARIDEFGGAFQTVLVVNAYQYLYFGSDHFRHRYFDHDTIFKYLRTICSGRIIFNNRIELKDCQNVNCIDFSDQRSQDYTEEKMLAAAAKYFKITQFGKIGKYPLFAFDVKSE